jgi:hypothetical protein
MHALGEPRPSSSRVFFVSMGTITDRDNSIKRFSFALYDGFERIRTPGSVGDQTRSHGKRHTESGRVPVVCVTTQPRSPPIVSWRVHQPANRGQTPDSCVRPYGLRRRDLIRLGTLQTQCTCFETLYFRRSMAISDRGWNFLARTVDTQNAAAIIRPC